MNVCPADTRNKRISESWKPMQTTAMSVEEYEELKKTEAFIRGAAVVTGKVWRGDHVGYYLNGIDLDNQKAIEKICDASIFNGKVATLQELAASTLLEQHPDDPTKLHLYVFSKHPFKNKTSDAGRSWFNIDAMPAIEVKGLKCLMFCTPSMHKGGYRYQFLNQIIPGLSENLELVINGILSEYDIEYLSKADLLNRGNQKKSDAAKTINEGSRHIELLREMNAKLHEFIRTKPLEEIRQMCIMFNNLYCKPPLDTNEFERMWSDAVTYVTEKEMEKDSADGSSGTTTELISVAEAIRRSSGKVGVKGLIIGVSSVVQAVKETEFECSNCGQSNTERHTPPLFSLPSSLFNNNRRRCSSCGESACYGPRRHKEISAMMIQIQDEKKQNELESLNVVLFDHNTVDVRNGEKAFVIGNLHVVQQRGNTGKRVTYLFADAIEYETPQHESVVITEEDLKTIEEFTNQPGMISKLVEMVAPTVIGHDDKKLGIVLMYVGATETQDFRGRIHGLFIGPPGTAKSKLARAAYRLGQPHSRYSSTQGASGKSITAIIDKDNDSYVLRNGVLPQARNSLCTLNEIGSLSMEDQRHLFDAMEEGKLTIDKYGFHKEIDSPTTVLATTNPEHGEWYMDAIDKGQIPLRKELVDRYDLIFVFESLRDRQQKVSYAKRKMAILKSQNVKEDHAFLRKVIEHAKAFNPTLSEEAEAMITDYWSSLNILVFPTNRVLETIIRVSIAFARLHFSDIVTTEIVKEAINFLTDMYHSFDSNIAIVQDPREVTCYEIAKFLQENPNMPYDFQDCINYAADHNILVEAYLGKSPVNNNNSKYRDIADRFKQGLVGGSLISVVNMNPLILIFKIAKEESSKNVL